MSATDDYSGEMPIPSRIDDPTAEALFAGRPVHPELDPLATVVRALRDVSQQPVPPSDELAASMAAGAFPDAAAGAEVPGRMRRAASRLRRAMLGRATGLRLAARLAAGGLAVGIVGVGSAGFAGTLPAPAQARFESVVESVSPYRFAERVDEDSPAGTPAGTPDGTGEPAPADEPGLVPGSPPTGAPVAPTDPQQTPGLAPPGDIGPGRAGDPPGHSDDDPGPPAAPPGLPADPPPAPPGPPGEAGEPPGRSGDAPGRSGDNPGAQPTDHPGPGRP
ncbi:hypothetical protein JQS43_07355 [Natronosporangium hydrolyticum]|uniref:Uncharacterized protein n=1 Tax=Natronosporangium hydrolyticum TaxID=2811111 RepID=A0A895YJ98_9ACTN|nr:hypothetical protein [Natronosporangium hydrolyticum]QSB16112.1 hypothetical protein JQS43_07355 [Natronosporangium hydrolyticum]